MRGGTALNGNGRATSGRGEPRVADRRRKRSSTNALDVPHSAGWWRSCRSTPRRAPCCSPKRPIASNNSETHRIETDPVRGPLVAKLEWYARGDVSHKAVTRLAKEEGLTHPRAHRPLAKSEIHRRLHNPIYAGDSSGTADDTRAIISRSPRRGCSRRFRTCSSQRTARGTRNIAKRSQAWSVVAGVVAR
jgi:hypothetical protein